MATSKRRSLKVGDVLELDVPGGYSYVQYVGKHLEYGDVIRVLPGCFKERPHDLRSLAKHSGFLAFYSARAAVSHGFVRTVGSFPLPDGLGIPKHLRRPGAREKGGIVRTWIVEKNGEERVRQELTDSEKQLPIAAIWDHELLVLRIAQGWCPEQDA